MLKTALIVFTSESIDNIPAGWRARETYKLVSADEFVEVPINAILCKLRVRQTRSARFFALINGAPKYLCKNQP